MELTSDLEKTLKDLRKRIDLYKDPSRVYLVGHIVRVDSSDGVYSQYEVLEPIDGGLFYLVKYSSKRKTNRGIINTSYEQIVPWNSHHLIQNNSSTKYYTTNRFIFNYYNSRIQSLIHDYFQNGVLINKEYQRDLVWSDLDKEKLIKSIFNRQSIGTFTILFTDPKDPISELYTHELIDGYQRLTTIMDFYSDRFKYQGKYFSELSYEDRQYYLSFNVSVALSESLPLKSKIELFLLVNDTGVKMDSTHLENIKNKLNEMEGKNA